MKSRRPDSKGTEWLLIKHRDAYVQEGYDIDKYDYSVLTQRSLKQIAGDEGSAEWVSSRKARPTVAPVRTTGSPMQSPKPSPRRRNCQEVSCVTSSIPYSRSVARDAKTQPRQIISRRLNGPANQPLPLLR